MIYKISFKIQNNSNQIKYNSQVNRNITYNLYNKIMNQVTLSILDKYKML